MTGWSTRKCSAGPLSSVHLAGVHCKLHQAKQSAERQAGGHPGGVWAPAGGLERAGSGDGVAGHQRRLPSGGGGRPESPAGRPDEHPPRFAESALCQQHEMVPSVQAEQKSSPVLPVCCLVVSINPRSRDTNHGLKVNAVFSCKGLVRPPCN